MKNVALLPRWGNTIKERLSPAQYALAPGITELRFVWEWSLVDLT